MKKENLYQSDRFKQILHEYGKTLSERTHTEYSRVTILICDYLKKDFLDIDDMDAQRYFNSQKAEIRTGSVTRKTVAMRLSSCNSIAKYIENECDEVVYTNPFKDIIRPEISESVNPTSVPTIEELDRIMTKAKEEDSSSFLLLALATRMGLSSTALVKLTVNDILDENGHLYLKTTPSSAKPSNLIMMPDDVEKILRDYMEELETDQKGHLFYNKRKRPLTIRNLDTVVKKIVKSSGIQQEYTLKDLRKRGVLELSKTIKDVSDKHKVAQYLGIKPDRLTDYMKAASYVGNACPPNLTNYVLRTEENI